jgi:hypothetical protein
MAEKRKLPVHKDVYKHSGGGHYRVLDHAVSNSTNAAQYVEMVLYVSLTNGQMFVRDKKEFYEAVEWPDGEVRPRFVLLSDCI